MSVVLDTNVIVRHLTGDPPVLARRATAFLGSGRHLLLTDVVVAELVYVLQSVYRVPRAAVAEQVRAVVGFPRVELDDEALVLRALDVYDLARVDFAEAYLVARAEQSGAAVASFDRSLDRIDTVTRIEP